MDRGDWQAIFHWGHKEWDTTEHVHTHTHTHLQVKISINPISEGENRHT